MKQLVNAVLASMLFLTACQKQHEPEKIEPDLPQAEPEVVDKLMGTYEFGGDEYPIYSNQYAETGSQIALIVSPLTSDRPITTYAAIVINSQLEGMVIDVDRAWHNDDYYFIYEDPIMYYSRYHELKSGTIMIKRLPTTGHYNIEVDVILPDHTPFKLSYSGEFSSAE